MTGSRGIGGLVLSGRFYSPWETLASPRLQVGGPVDELCGPACALEDADAGMIPAKFSTRKKISSRNDQTARFPRRCGGGVRVD